MSSPHLTARTAASRWSIPAGPVVLTVAAACLFMGMSMIFEGVVDYSGPVWDIAKGMVRPLAAVLHAGAPMGVWGGMFIACCSVLTLGAFHAGADGLWLKVAAYFAGGLFTALGLGLAAAGFTHRATLVGAVTFATVATVCFIVGHFVEPEPPESGG